MGGQTQFVKTIQGRHNAMEAGKALGFGALALVLWYVSFWIVAMLVILPFLLAGHMPSWGLVTGVAWGGMVLLAVEGMLYGKRLFDTAAARRSFYMQGVMGTETEKAVALAGDSAERSSMKSPKLASPSSPTGVSSEIAS